MVGIDISLAHFLRTGLLAEIAIGHERARVEAILGRPDDSGGRGSAFAIERYAGGKIEISFRKERAVLIAVYVVRGSDRASGDRLVDDLGAERTDSVGAFKKWYDAERIDYCVRLDDGDSCILAVQRGASAVFHGGTLDSLQSS